MNITNESGDTVQFGSCWPTAYACLLDLELDQVPNWNLCYWTIEEKRNISAYLRDRFLDGVTIDEFTGATHQKENFYHFAHMSTFVWDNTRTYWLAAKGFKEEWITDIDEWLKNNLDVPYMASGRSPRGLDHVCIYVNGQLHHDPHPSGEGLVDIWKEYPYSYLKKIV